MRESFVLHSEYIEDLPEDYRQKFLMYVYNYGIHEEIPVLKGLEQSLWIKIQRRIDLDHEQYETRKQKLKEYKENWKKKKNDSVNSESFGIIPTNTHSVTVSDIVNDIVNVNDIVSVNVNDIDTVSDAPSTLTDSQKNYSNKIFNIFKEAGLPCSKGNELTFLQTDFKNAISYIHNSEELKNFSSQDIVQACKNFVTVYKNEQCYLKNKWNFFALVKSKSFYNLLPGNFDIENFYNFQSKQTKAEEEKPEEKKVYSFKPCPSCKAEMKVFWNQNKNKYECDNCHKLFGFDEYLGEL